MTSVTTLELLERRLRNTHRDPAARLLQDLHDLPEDLRRSVSVQLDAAIRVAGEERLQRQFDAAIAQVESKATDVVVRIGDAAAVWAGQEHLKIVNSLIKETIKTMPVHVEARRRAYWELGIGGLLIFVLAALTVIGAQKLGVIPHPALTDEQSQQWQLGAKIDSSGHRAAVSWAIDAIDTDEKLLEAQAAVAAADKGKSARSELRDLKACRYPGMVLVQSSSHGWVCWFPYRPGNE
ncbi:hypothetical protein GGQ97_001539 [Sphingomonas kaistensis]|uniref:Uncharacterized protein n=1 Tax=Sphingomonas kaistensis TaxID=298708 RepID=A0A7X5Y5Z6_9SPHN|nr:hypothetical protein [Sphingomonas kaistensis]NJC05746.1 hypothetical protein [Sphingomonas kaistensis]